MLGPQMGQSEVVLHLFFSPTLKYFAFPFSQFSIYREMRALIIKNEKCHNVKYEMINNFFTMS